MALRVTPAVPTAGTPITVSDRVTNVNNNLVNLLDLVPEPGTVGYPLVSTAIGTGTSAAIFKKLTAAGIDSAGLNADTVDGLEAAAFSLVGHTHGVGGTAGEVTMWNGSSGTIPSGRILYSVMTDRFPVAANNNFAFGSEGGSQTHFHTSDINHQHGINDHQHGQPGHTHTTPGHVHGITQATNSAENVQNDGDEARTFTAPHDHGGATQSGGSSNTGSSGGDNTNMGGTSTTLNAGSSALSTDTRTHLPPYRAVTFMVQT